MRTKGFTLVEVLVALIISVLVVGSSMALIGGIYKGRQRMNERIRALPVIDTAAQALLKNPALVHDDHIVLKELPGSPVVHLTVTRVDDDDVISGAVLYRVKLRYGGNEVEFSVINIEE